MYIPQKHPKLEVHIYEIHKKIMTCVFNWVHDRLTSQVDQRSCLPQDGSHTWPGNASEVRIGIKAYDRLVICNNVAAQDAVQHLTACLVAFRSGILKEFDKVIPDLNTVLAQASFCACAGSESDPSY